MFKILHYFCSITNQETRLRQSPIIQLNVGFFSRVFVLLLKGKMTTRVLTFTLNGVFLEDFSALSTCILSLREVNDLGKKSRVEGWREGLGLATKTLVSTTFFSGRVCPGSKLRRIRGCRLPSPIIAGAPKKNREQHPGLKVKSALCWWEATAGGSIQPGARVRQPASKTRPPPPGAFSGGKES